MRFLFFCLTFCCITQSVLALDSYADLVEELMPSVVNISTERTTISNDDESIDNQMLNPLLDGREALGSGFFIRNDGYLLTNAHVINGAKRITVITDSGKEYHADIQGIDEATDLAVLKIKGLDKNKQAETFSNVKFGNADKSRIGDIVLTFGNPYGLGVSVSQGIISAKSRNIGLNEQQYIQTDAAINQGNSGGPMFNLNGEVIGVNAVIFTAKGANGVGFSLPSNIANWVSTQLIKNGKVRRGWIGISVAEGIDQYTEKSGLVITEIDEDSNAYKEGIRVGDIIISYDNKQATDVNTFLHYIETMELGQTLRLTTLTLGEKYRNVIRIQEMPVDALKRIANKALIENRKYYNETTESGAFYISELKIAVKEATPRGLEIVKIERDSPLYESGIAKGDVLLEADKADIYSVDNLLDSIRNAVMDDFRPITLFVQGIENTFYTTIQMEQEDD